MLLLLAPGGLLFGLLLAFIYINRTKQGLRRLIYTRLIFVVILFISTLFALRYWLVFSNSCIPQCVGANLLGQDLSGRNLTGANFVHADLTGTNLAKARLRGADLSGAILNHVNLQGADLQNARLAGADLRNANLTGANLLNADLGGADLDHADLTGVDLTQTDLAGAHLSNAQLVRANLIGAELAAIDMSGAILNGAQLARANLSGATLSRADLSSANFNQSNLSGAWLNLSNLTGAVLTQADLSGASLIAANLSSADLSNSSLVGASLVGAILDGVNLRSVNLTGVKLNVSELITNDLSLDPLLAELNELQRSQLLVDVGLDGVIFDNQTVWPNSDVVESMETAAAIADTNVTLPEETIKVGILHSLSGDLAISESAVRDAVLLAIDEINAAGGVLGKPLEAMVEDGGSDPALFAEKAAKLLEEDKVAVIFGCWTSSSRKAVLPVVEELDGLLFYPVQYEGLESSPNIFYLGATPSQQILPAIEYLVAQGHEQIMLLGSDYIFPRTANAIIKAQLAAAGKQISGEIYVPLGHSDFSQFLSQIALTPPDAIFSTLNGESNVAFFNQLAEAGFTAETLPVMSVSIAEEEVKAIGPALMVGHLTAWSYYQSLATPENFAFVTAFKTVYGEERVTSDPIAAGYTAVYLWKLLVESADSTATDAVRAAAATLIELPAPEGLVRIDGKSQHLYKTARIGVIQADGSIKEVFSSPAPIAPDPFLSQYPWAKDVIATLQSEAK